MEKFNYKKYQLLDCLDEISSTQKMIELHDDNSDRISNFMMSQYRDMRKQSIIEFNKISYGKKISND
jgi:hypothetical protein